MHILYLLRLKHIGHLHINFFQKVKQRIQLSIIILCFERIKPKKKKLFVILQLDKRLGVKQKFFFNHVIY